MAKGSCNISANEIEELVFNSVSEAQFELDYSDNDSTYDFLKMVMVLLKQMRNGGRE
jgi:hypothetical protein